jgi:PAS domain S-box-containing protein
MSLLSATAFLFLCLGIFCARPAEGVMGAVTSMNAGGVMARRMLPAAIGIPVLLGWLRLLGQRAGLYDSEFGVALSVVATTSLFVVLIWWSAVLLNRIEAGRRQAEENVSSSEEKFRALAHTAREAIISADSRGNITYFNHSAEMMFGFPADGMVGKPLTLLMPPRFLDAHHHGFARFLATGEAHVIGKTVELAGQRVDGSEFPIDLSLASWQSGGETFFTAIIRDTTRRKLAEERIQKLNDDLERRTSELETVNKELETFAYSVSHDLRAPLRAIDGFSLAVLETSAGKLDAESTEDLQRVRAACQRMGNLINDLLGLSRVARAEMRLTSVNLSELAQQILAELQKANSARQIELSIAPTLTANADAALIRIALENLLSNAWKFTGKRSVARIEFGAAEQNGLQSYFVRDNGAGFDMAQAGKLFAPFQRLHPPSEFEGTGIGLATVQRIIRRHGGRVWAEAAVEKGATFYFTLSP